MQLRTDAEPDCWLGSGREVYYTDPNRFDWCYDSIKELATICSVAPRAHGIYSYSILQHLKFTRALVKLLQEKGIIPSVGPRRDELELVMLIHDLHEGIISDIPGPLKKYIRIASLEHGWTRGMDRFFGVNRLKGLNTGPDSLYQIHKKIDKIAFYYETKIFAPIIASKKASSFINEDLPNELIQEYINQSNSVEEYLHLLGIKDGINTRTRRNRKTVKKEIQ